MIFLGGDNMKPFVSTRLFLMALIVTFLLTALRATEAQGQFADILKGIKGALPSQEKLSASKVIEGLKEALRIGTQNAVAIVSKPGGYLKNEAIKILVPPSVKKAEGVLRTFGYGEQLDAFEESMNKAAEKAAPLARDVFLKSLKEMSVDDAEAILKGDDTAATRYFKEKTFNPLSEQFKPFVKQSMQAVGVTKKYMDLEDAVKKVPFADTMSFNLDDYVTKGALDGLFTMLGEEEKKIRNDPGARVTDVLKEVFGKK
ncbi:MAG: DUF4197 domain-containing protein [Deltaproteobacteria bacterium CG_4_9_14_3_um_filter_51_14]|nr:MAG: DUF4197 domain-containing protein [Deltaproteobacteria bacterium CG_4_9_14_3_um_filter_51_14]